MLHLDRCGQRLLRQTVQVPQAREMAAGAQFGMRSPTLPLCRACRAALFSRNQRAPGQLRYSDAAPRQGARPCLLRCAYPPRLWTAERP